MILSPHQYAFAAVLLLVPPAMLAQANAAEALPLATQKVVIAELQSERAGQSSFGANTTECAPTLQSPEGIKAAKNIQPARIATANDQSSENIKVDSPAARILGQDELQLSIAARILAPQNGAPSCSVNVAPE